MKKINFHTKKDPVTKKKKAPKRPGHLFGVNRSKQQVIENLGILVQSGVSIIDALSSIRKEIRSKQFRIVIDFMIKDIEMGLPVSTAFEKTDLFKPNIISLIRIGEQSGRLSENLSVISLNEKKNHEFQARIKSAMLYPVFVLSITVIIALGISWFVLPRLATVFSQLNLELPAVTDILIKLGLFLQTHGYYVVPLVALFLFICIFIIFIYKKTRFIGQEILFAIPGIHKLIRDIELARFGFLLGSLLTAGMPISHALQSTQESTIFPRYRKFYAFLNEAIQNGHTFRDSFQMYKKSSVMFPPSIQQIVISGEQSGSLAESLTEIGRAAELRTENATKNIAVILEPILLVIVWLGVVAVAFAVITPIYSLVNGLHI